MRRRSNNEICGLSKDFALSDVVVPYVRRKAYSPSGCGHKCIKLETLKMSKILSYVFKSYYSLAGVLSCSYNQ